MLAAAVIPARYGSTRFPGKPLARIAGKPLIQHVYENARRAKLLSDVIVATDSEEIAKAVEVFGGRAEMTNPAHTSGTDRIAEVAAKNPYEAVVNVQGDEPLLKAESIDAALRLLDDPRADIGTLVRPITDRATLLDPNVVKAVVGNEGFALYFSRAQVPWHRELWRNGGGVTPDGASVYQHIGIYAYRREALLRFALLPPTRVEQIEQLEQLRALEHGMRIKVSVTDQQIMGVDTPEDIERVESWLSTSS